MAWYAYCIGEKNAFPELARHRKPIPMESILGVSGNQVFLYPASDLAVIVSEHSTQKSLNQQSGMEHARVVAGCFEHSTVLPFRFGTIFDDDESLRRSIRANQRQFLDNISKLHGKTEMHLKIFVDDCCGRTVKKHQPADGLNQEYFTNLLQSAGLQRERQTRARAVSFQMHRLFLPVDENVSCRLAEGGKMVLDIAHLINRKSVERYVSKFSATSATMKECRMQLSGPWPPYHFVLGLTRCAHSHPQQTAVPVPMAEPVVMRRVHPTESAPAFA
jgi:hypothetical protein